jgi:hypothetical protein
MGCRKIANYRRSGSILIEAAVAAGILAGIALFALRTVSSAAQVNRSAAVAALSEAHADIRAGEIRRIPLSQLMDPVSPAVPTTVRTFNAVPLGQLYGVPVLGSRRELRQVEEDAVARLRTHTIFIGVQYTVNNRNYVKTRVVRRYESY